MKARTLMALSALATLVLGVHYWLLSGPGRPPQRPGAAPGVALAPAAPAASAIPAPASRATTASAAAPDTAPAVAVAGSAPRAKPAAARPASAPAAAVPRPAASAAATTQTPAEPAADAAPNPVYRTRIPPSTQIAYRISRGAISGNGSLNWQADGGSYLLKLEGKVPIVGTLITQVSRGGFDGAGLAPLRFTDKRLRRSEQAANFERDGSGGGQVSFSGPPHVVPLHPGIQDRLSVMVQLAAIAEAWPQPPAPGARVVVHVVGARGDDARWSLRFEGVEGIRTADGETVSALKFQREPDSPHATRAEFWLDPGRHHLPVRARLTDGDHEAFELLRQGPP